MAQVIEMLRAAEGATIAELAEAMGWLPHTTRAVLTGLRKRGYALRLDRSDAGRRSAYRIAVDGNDAHATTAPTVIASSAARIDEASDPPVSSARPASPAALRRCRSSGTSRAA
jgi:DNA-binding MarR family transcriptional regulator